MNPPRQAYPCASNDTYQAPDAGLPRPLCAYLLYPPYPPYPREHVAFSQVGARGICLPIITHHRVNTTHIMCKMRE